MSNRSALMTTEPIKRQRLDVEIERLSQMKMGQVVRTAEGQVPKVGFPNYEKNAAQHLVSRMFTDAVFNQDIYVIQTIINRIDGGLPKDCEVDDYRTLFGDCMLEVLSMEKATRLKIYPEDTVMLALCKALYDIASEDIYWDNENGKRRKPPTDKKKERDAALRMVLERAGGRKTAVEVVKALEDVEAAEWLSESLPEGQPISEESEEKETQDSHDLV